MPFTPPHFACWFEIPVTDLDRAMAFYGRVFAMDLKVTQTDPHPMVDFPTATPDGVSGHLFVGQPSGAGPVIHLVVPDTLAAAKARLAAAGGRVESPDIEIPPGTFCYARDPDGNRLGLFELRAA
jgi:predicted enzyme related to lactoylglutathione lyase